MKRLFHNLCLLIFIILFIPYFLTAYMTGSGERKGQLDYNEIDILYDKDGDEIHLNMEEYLIGALFATVPFEYEPEMLKAQAVILRTFVAGTETTSGSIAVEELGFDYKNDSDIEKLQEESGFESHYANVLTAVEETKNEVLYFNNKLISPFFHEVSVGMTRDATEMFSEGLSYIQIVECIDDKKSENYMCITEESIEEIADALNQAYDTELSEENFLEKVLILERDSLGYVKTADIDGVKVTGEEIADCLSLNSSNFYFQEYEGKLRIICKGKGHGFGLSQYTANEMAKEGLDYKEILYRFYSNIKIKKIN